MSCSTHAFETVWDAFDRARGDTVSVPRKELTELVTCHRANVGHEPADMIEREPRANARNIDCKRAPLFAMLKSHKCEPSRGLTPRR
jgi:hypothetical protein